MGERLNNLTSLIKEAHQGAAHKNFFEDLNEFLSKLRTQLLHHIKIGSIVRKKSIANDMSDVINFNLELITQAHKKIKK